MTPSSISQQAKALHPSLNNEDLKAISELFESLAECATVHDAVSNASQSASAANSDWAVIDPSTTHSKCRRNVVAFAIEKKDWREGLGLTEALTGLVDYYSRCIGTVKLGLLITDVWRPFEIRQFRHDLELHRRNHGVRSVPFLWSGRHCLPLVWTWQ